MKFCIAILAAIAAAPVAPAHAQTKLLVVGNTSLIDREFVFGKGAETRTTPIVIPQTNGGSATGIDWGNANPGKVVAGVLGLGPTTSIINFTSATDAAGYLVTTQDWDTKNVYTAQVIGLKLNGPHAAALGQFPQSGVPGTTSLGVAVRLNARNTRVENCEITNYRGTGVYVGNLPDGSGYHTFAKRITGNTISRLVNGVQCSSDVMVDGNMISGIQDYGLWVPSIAGNVQSTSNNIFGCGTAIRAQGPGLNSANDVASDAQYGVHLSGAGHRCNFTNLISIHCVFANVLATSSYNSFANCKIDVAKPNDGVPEISGYHLGGFANTITGGVIQLHAYDFPWATYSEATVGSTAILLDSGAHDNFVDTTVSGLSRPDGGYDVPDIGVHVKAAVSGNRITLNIPDSFNFSEAPACRLLVVDSGARANMRNNVITFRGKSLAHAVANPANFVDIPSGGLHASNVITIIDTSNSGTGPGGASQVTLAPDTAY